MAVSLAEARSPVTSFFLKFSCLMFFVTSGLLGGWTGTLIANKKYVLSAIERFNLTPEVRPGEALLLAQHVDRHAQCDIVLKRTISTGSGQRFFIKQEFEEGFGPLGGDKYILPIPMPASATFGMAKMYTKGFSWCSWIDYVLGPSESEGWTIDFDFAENTVESPRPAAFANIGFKTPSRPASTGPQTR